MSTSLMRTVAASLTLLSVLFLSGGIPAQDKKEEVKPKAESVTDALTKATWQHEIDLAPRFGGKVNPVFHDRPGVIGFKTDDKKKLVGNYQYKTGIGVMVEATLEVTETTEAVVKVTFTEKGPLNSKGFGEFKVQRDPKTGKVTKLEGWWKLNPIDPELKWLVYRVPVEELKASVKKTLTSSTWVCKTEYSVESFRKAGEKAGTKKETVEEYIKKNSTKDGYIPADKEGTIQFKQKDGQFLLLHTQPPSKEVGLLVTNLQADGLKLKFKASGNTEAVDWTLEFTEKDGAIIKATGTTKVGPLDARVTLEPKDSDKK